MKFFELFLAFTLSLNASAHGVHENVDFAGVFGEMVEHNFHLHPRQGDGVTPNFIKLPDGTTYALDSAYWQAVRDLAQEMANEAERGASPEKKIWIRRSLVWLWSHIEELSQREFWIELAVNTEEMVVRFGVPVGIMYAAAESAEHSVIPFPFLCAAIQAFCVKYGKQAQEVTDAFTSRYPLDAPLPNRVGVGMKYISWKLLMWWSMRRIYSGERPEFSAPMASARPRNAIQRSLAGTAFRGVLLELEENQPHDQHQARDEDVLEKEQTRAGAEILDGRLTPMQRFAAAEFQLAFLDLQMRWAKLALQPWISKNASLYRKSRRALTGELKAIDTYGLIVRRLSKVADHIPPFAALLMEKFYQRHMVFLRGFRDYLELLQHGLVPFDNAVSERVFNAPAETLRWLKTYQKTGALQFLDCEMDLVPQRAL